MENTMIKYLPTFSAACHTSATAPRFITDAFRTSAVATGLGRKTVTGERVRLAGDVPNSQGAGIDLFGRTAAQRSSDSRRSPV